MIIELETTLNCTLCPLLMNQLSPNQPIKSTVQFNVVFPLKVKSQVGGFPTKLIFPSCIYVTNTEVGSNLIKSCHTHTIAQKLSIKTVQHLSNLSLS